MLPCERDFVLDANLSSDLGTEVPQYLLAFAFSGLSAQDFGTGFASGLPTSRARTPTSPVYVENSTLIGTVGVRHGEIDTQA
jgi:hypothetical protein